MSTQESYESNMRVIGYLCNILRDNYGTIHPEDYYTLSGQITGLLRQTCGLLPPDNEEPRLEPEPTIYNTPTPMQQSVDLDQVQYNSPQSNVTMTRGTNLVDLTFENDLPLSFEELNYNVDADDSSNFMDTASEEYQEYISTKVKPKLTTKCFTKTEGREKICECIICCDEHNLHQVLTLGCGHEFCKTCLYGHFHHSVENQPYKRFYSCPACRADVKQVRINYSKINAKHKKEILASAMATELKIWCK